MKKSFPVPLLVFGILMLAVLISPVSGGLIIAEEGATVLATDGATSPVIQITDPSIDPGGTIVIDVSQLQYEFLNGYIEDANIDVSTTAPGVTWDPEITDGGWTVTLTSSGGVTAPGDNVTVTFRGSPTNPWNADWEESFTVPVTRVDTGDTVSFSFEIDTPEAPAGGLTIADGIVVTSTTGATSPVITIIGSPVDSGGTITIDTSILKTNFLTGAITGPNIDVQSTTADTGTSWTPVMSADNNTLTLASSGGSTVGGDTIAVTLRGTGGNPWIEGPHSLLVTATRDDTLDSASFEVRLEIAPQGSLTVADGEPIVAARGNSSPVITISNRAVAMNDTISIDTSGLNPYVVGGNLTPENVEITDNAAAATWTGTLAGDNLTLTSTGGATESDETVIVTFTGAAGSEWVADTGAAVTVPLTATRNDTLKTANFNVVIDTGGRPSADFSASPLTGMAPVTVTFADNSSRSPIGWNWSFGDGTFSEEQNPLHVYSTGGLYTVSLNITNTRGSNISTKTDYITIYNGAKREANTTIPGLTINNCIGSQTVTVDRTVLNATLSPNTSVLEIQPGSDRGFKNITFYALNGIGFTQNGNQITGNPTSVHLVSEEIPPPGIFSDYIGVASSFNYSLDLPAYPCNALLTTNVREGVAPATDAKVLRIANGNTPPAILKETAYTAKITRTNFASVAPVTIHMSINRDWRTRVDPTSIAFIWHISDDENSGQILPTTSLSTGGNLDYYEADSPGGMSTFGLSAFTGNNNPFQLVTFVLASVISEPQVNNNPNQDMANKGAVPVTVATTITTEITPDVSDPGNSAKLYANSQGTITQATILRSTDGLATLSLGLGIVAKDRDGKPLASVSIARIPPEKVPHAPPASTLPGAISAYELQPDGAVFSPGIPLNFAPQPGTPSGQEFTVKTFDSATGTWKEIPSQRDPGTGTITAQVSHFCAFGLFAKTATAEPSATVTRVMSEPVPTSAPPPPSNAMSIVGGMFVWLVNLVSTNLLIVAFAIILTGSIVIYRRNQGREW